MYISVPCYPRKHLMGYGYVVRNHKPIRMACADARFHRFVRANAVEKQSVCLAALEGELNICTCPELGSGHSQEDQGRRLFCSMIPVFKDTSLVESIQVGGGEMDCIHRLLSSTSSPFPVPAKSSSPDRPDEQAIFVRADVVPWSSPHALVPSMRVLARRERRFKRPSFLPHAREIIVPTARCPLQATFLTPKK